MHALYVMQPGSYLKKDGETLKIIRNDVLVDIIPAEGLTHLALAGRATVSGAVLDYLIKKRIDTVFMTVDGRFRARLLLDEAGHVALRQKQYIRLADPAYSIKVAKAVVAEKLENQSRLLLRRAAQLQVQELRTVAAQIKALKKRLERAEKVDEVRGVEGYGTRLYFSVFGILIRNDKFQFTGRNRRPPRDPVNGMLSFVYTLFTNEVVNGIKSCGLDPYLGTLHEIVSGRPSLACDLVEEWRVFAERLVLTLINKKVVDPTDFIYRSKKETDAGALPVEMKPAMMRSLIGSYHKQLEGQLHYPPTGLQTSLRWIIHNQCRRFAESLDGDTLYRPFCMPR